MNDAYSATWNTPESAALRSLCFGTFQGEPMAVAKKTVRGSCAGGWRAEIRRVEDDRTVGLDREKGRQKGRQRAEECGKTLGPLSQHSAEIYRNAAGSPKYC
jgi:hypothetical protein